MTAAAHRSKSITASLGAALLLALLIALAGPSPAAAATCDASWAGGGSGLWLNNGNWVDGDADPNNNVPGLGDNVCITQPGTYTVTIIDNGVVGGGSAKSITVGDGDTSNGTVTLSIASSTSGGGNPQSGSLNGLDQPSTIASDGIVELIGAGSDPGQAELLNGNNGVINNSGVLRSAAGSGGSRLFNITLNNLAGGTVDIAYDATQSFTRTWTNNGTFNVADGATFTLTGSGQGPIFNQSGGTLVTNSSGVLFMNGGTFNHTGGSQNGNEVQLCGPRLNAPSGGAAAFDFVRVPAESCGGGSLGADIGAGKVVRMNNGSNSAMGVSLAASIANNGALILTGPAEDQLLGGNTLTNNATLQVTGIGGRLVGNNIINSATGSIDIDQDVNFAFTPTLTNNGAIGIGAGETMSLTGSGQGAVYNQNGGSLDVGGTLNHGGGTYIHSGGTTTVASGGAIQASGTNIAMSGGTLRGAGTVAVGTLSNTGGTVRPGSSPGILTVTGNYAQGAGGTLAAEIAGTAPGTGYSRLAVSGGATLAGELDVTNTISPAGGSQFQVLTAAGGRSGTFSTLDVHGSPSYSAAYGANGVTLTANRPPAAPSLTGTNPASGANNNAPKILGNAVAGSTVRIYNTAGCTGTPVATGSAAQLAAGIAVSVADNSTTSFRATASNGDGTSTCSAALTYVENSKPAAPTLSGTDPVSGSDDNSPRIKGSAAAGTTVRIYTSAGCSGSPVASGSAAELAGAGIEVTVDDNSTTTFRATASNVGGTSSCSSSSVTYVEDTAAPAGKVKFAKQPKKKTAKKTATFKFNAPDAVSYECKLDKKPFAPCSSPVKLKKLKKGQHKFKVRGIGEDGQAGPTTSYGWKVKKQKK